MTLYIGLSDLYTRIRKETLITLLDFERRGYLLDDDPTVLAVIRPACVDIDSALGGVFTVPFDAPPDTPEKIVEVALDGAVARLGAMHPTVIIIDHVALAAKVKSDLTQIRKGEMNIGVEPPDPAANHGGAVYPTPDPTNNVNVPVFVQVGSNSPWGIF